MSSIRRLREVYLLLVATLFVFVAQVIDLVFDFLSVFDIEVELGVFDYIVGFIDIVLAIAIFREFMITELNLSERDANVMVTFFTIFNINVILKLLAPREVLLQFRDVLNLIPLILIFIILPLYMVTRYKSIKSYVKLFFLALFIVYPLAQLYILALERLVTIAAAIYLVYLVYKMLETRMWNSRSVLDALFNFDDIVVDKIRGLAKPGEGRFFFSYLYVFLLLLADVLLFIIPGIIGMWADPSYYELLRTNVPAYEVQLPVIMLILSFIIVSLYPVIEKLIEAQKTILLLLLVIGMVYYVCPILAMAPIESPDAYGVILKLYKLRIEFYDLIVPLALTLLIIMFIVVYQFKAREVAEKAYSILKWVLLAMGTSLMIPYLLVYTYSLYYSILLFYMRSPYLSLVAPFMGFIAFLMFYVPYRLIRIIRLRSIKLGKLFLIETLLLFLVAITLSYSPSSITLVLFILYSLIMICISTNVKELIPRALLVTYMSIFIFFPEYITYLALLLVFYGLYMDYVKIKEGTLGINSKYILLGVLIIIPFSLAGYFVGEYMPFTLSLTSIMLLAVLSSCEEAVFKGMIYNNSPRIPYRAFITSVLFSTMHILKFNIFAYYTEAGTLIPYLLYTFSYQYITLKLYDKVKALSLFMVIHTLINVGIVTLYTIM